MSQPIDQRHADMCIWQAFLMANCDPNYGELQDAWDALGEDHMRGLAIFLSNQAFGYWHKLDPATQARWTYADFCEVYVGLTGWILKAEHGACASMIPPLWAIVEEAISNAERPNLPPIGE